MVSTMSDTEPTAEQPEQPAQPPDPTPVPAGPRLRDRVFGLRSVVMVALAGVILGGLGGFGIHAATHGDDRDGRFGPGGGFQNGPGGRGGPGGFPQGPGQQGPGQMGPGGQAPQAPQAPQPSQSSGQSS